MHQYLNIQHWHTEFYQKFTSTHVDGLDGRFLLRKSRVENTPTLLNDIARAYKKAQSQHDKWRKAVLNPLFAEIKELAVDKKVQLHAKPTHEYSGEQGKWYIYTYSDSGNAYGWGYSFNWIDEPEEKINYNLGQKLYDLDQYQRKFHSRTFQLSRLLEQYLNDYIWKLYDLKWITKNQFSGQLVKFTLQGDEYWYRIGYSRYGHPIWENFVWQSNKTIDIQL